MLDKHKPAFTFCIFLLIALSSHFESSCQNPQKYAPGTIITQNRDTLRGLVENSLSYKSEITIKLDGESTVLSVDSILYLTHSDIWFERIEYTHRKKKYQKLMKILSYGAINLYVDIPSDISYRYLDLKYFAKKKGVVFALSNGNYKKGMATLIADSPPTTEFFIRTKYKMDKIFEVIDYYNLNKN
jgi:hypothetical protein